MSRPFNTSTPLGQILLERGLSVRELAEGTGIHSRTLSDYLANRVPILRHHLIEICDALDLEPEELEIRENA